MTLRDWRAGELRFLLTALIIAVAALSSVSFFVDRMRDGLNRDAHQLLGADLVIIADRPLEPSWQNEAQRRELAFAETQLFASMATAGEGERSTSILAAIKSVSEGYPLRGNLKVSVQPDVDGMDTRDIPAPGTVWVDSALLNGLNVNVGDSVMLGDKRFTVARVIVSEPDRGISFFGFAPRVMLSMQDLPGTGLVQPGSRVTYRLLLSGRQADIKMYQDWAQKKIDSGEFKGVRVESLETGRPEMRATLDRGERFLALVGLLSAMLAAVAIAMAARRFMMRHLDACAMLRCLGMTQNQATALYLIEFLVIGLIGSVIGAVIGFGAHFILIEGLSRFVLKELPPVSVFPAIKAVAIGLLLLVGFAMPPILQLRNVPHNRVIRREREAPKPMMLVTYGSGLAVFTGLLLWQAGNAKLGLLTAGGFLGGFAVFAMVAWLCLQSLRMLRTSLRKPDWNFALTSLQRRPGATILQTVALATGLMALLLLTVIRADLMNAWRSATPPDAPNHFIINIQPDQKADVEQRIRQAGIDPQLFPMVRGRLIKVNDSPVGGETYIEDRAKRLVEREFNLSYMAELPAHNQISAGHWFGGGRAEASVEDGLAKTLNLKLGDKLLFDVAGQPVEATITSLRKLDWGSMRVNFFVIMNPEALQDMPQSWITALYLPKGMDRFPSELTREFSNLTVIDIGSILAQLQSVLDQVITAVEFLFLFTLASGFLVLYAALLGSQDERIREAGLLRALGATRRQLRQAQLFEFAIIGALSGLLAATGAAVVGWALARYVFDFPWSFNPVVWLAGLIVGSVCAIGGGRIGLRNVLNHPPLQTLRET